ncbi:MAG TPA: DUF3326 domain-containing protein [Candidatus Kapabacteria bacterium]|nr:DUF3326 domain-containing protein [Candidatus Kapabacteria bacterium]
MIENKEYIINRSEFQSIEELPGILERKAGRDILRWHISRVTGNEIIIETTLFDKAGKEVADENTGNIYPGKNVVLSIVPTGVGCEIGGYAADAAPATNLLASCADYLITNPNAVNASNFISMADNVFYTEGFTIDLFCKGLVNLYKPYVNKVGLIIEKEDRDSLETVYNIINTVRAVHGVDMDAECVVVTEESFGGRCMQYQSGAYVGTVDKPEVLFKAVECLIEKGVNSIGITSNIKDLPKENYAKHFDGLHPNPIGGAEAIISHLITEKYRIPAAHAPMINIKELALKSNIVDARGAGEFASPSGLACILIGLSKAPQLSRTNFNRIQDVININNLSAVVAPAGTLGGIPLLYAQKYNIPIIAVRENKTILDVTSDKLKLKNVYVVNNYLEAAGLLQALRLGISIKSLHRPLETLRPTAT